MGAEVEVEVEVEVPAGIDSADGPAVHA